MKKSFEGELFLTFAVSCILILSIGVTSVFAVEEINLNGQWKFTYKPGLTASECISPTTVSVLMPKQPAVPLDKEFEVSIEVPGYWYDFHDRLKKTSWWSNARFDEYKPVKFFKYPYEGEGVPPALWPRVGYLVGVGWYKKEIEVPKDWAGKTVTMTIGGARVESFVFINGMFAGYHFGHNTPFETDLTDHLEYGKTNCITIAVSNLAPYINSCALRGFQSSAAGIYGDVVIHVSDGPGRIESLFLRPIKNLSKIRWWVDLKAKHGTNEETTKLCWKIADNQRKTIKSGEINVRALEAGELYRLEFDIDSNGIGPWSVWKPQLYSIEAVWKKKDKVWDCKLQSFGMREMKAEDKKLFLNSRPIYLRGTADHCYFAPNIHPPLSNVEYFRKIIRRLKELGFNFIRCHTWVPSQEFMQAADEEGILFQVELSSPKTESFNNKSMEQWQEIIKWSRSHPSVVLYCGGNEEIANEGLIYHFEQRYLAAKELDPSCLVVPMESIDAVETNWTQNGKPVIPVPAHLDMELPEYQERLLKRINRSTDVFAVRNNDISYSNFQGGSWKNMESKLSRYDMPIISHESGIIGCYLDLTLKDRYTGTIPPDFYEAAIENLKDAGRLHMARQYYENSALWSAATHKYVLEEARKCKSLDGYNHLGAWDSHWLLAGYACGIMNEFLELRHGNTVEQVLQYNGESVALLDNEKEYVFWEGDAFAKDIIVSLFGGCDLRSGELVWSVSRDGDTLLSGKIKDLCAPDGDVTKICKLEFRWPEVKESCEALLKVSIRSEEYNLSNQWRIWIFKKRDAPKIRAGAKEGIFVKLSNRFPGLKRLESCKDEKLRIVDKIGQDDIEHLKTGGDVLLLGTEPFPSKRTAFQIGVAGRALMDFATVVNKHPVFKYLPNNGWCDWQFKKLLDGGSCVIFNELPTEFDPILEVVSSYKYVRLQASVWETNVEGGRLFVASCNFDSLNDPATVAMLDGVLEYVTSKEFQPKTRFSIESINKLLLSERKTDISDLFKDDPQGNLSKGKK